MDIEALRLVAQRLGLWPAQLYWAFGLKTDTENLCSAKTISEARTVCLSARPDSSERYSAWQKWCQLLSTRLDQAKTVDEVWRVYNTSPPHSAVAQAARVKLNKLAGLAIEEASSAKKAKSVYFDTPEASEIKSLGWQRWHQLALAEIKSAETVADVREVPVPAGSEAERQALRKLANLCQKKAVSI